MIHETGGEAKMKESSTNREATEYFVLLVRHAGSDSKYITSTRHGVLEKMCETPILISTQAAGLKKVAPHEKVAKHHGCMTAEGILYVYPGHPVCTTIANFGKAEVNLPKHQKVREVESAPQEIFDINDVGFSYHCVAKVSESESAVNAVHFKPTPDRRIRIPKNEAVNEKHEAILNKNWIRDVQLSAKSENHRPVFLEMLKELESMCNGQLGLL